MAPLLWWLAPNTAFAAVCDEWALFKSGAVMVMSSFDKKGQLTTTVTTKNQGVSGGVATLHAETADAKGKTIGGADYTLTCDDGAVAIDMRAFFPQEQLAAFSGMTATFEGTNLDFPHAMSTGQTLADATVKVALSPADASAAGPVSLMAIDLKIKDRRVGASASVTTPAGTFTAWPISSTVETVTTAVVPIRVTVASVDWYTPGVGVVKTETSRNGKPAGTTELTSLQR